MIDTLFGFIAPHSCYGCGEIGSVICDHCANDITQEPFTRCIFCMKLTSRAAICARCTERYDLCSAWCIGERRETLKSVLDAYKFERVRSAAESFARLMDETIPVLDPDTVVTAIPTVPAHIRQRGYDHAELAAKRFARLRGLPYRPLLERRDTHTQHTSSRQDRLRNAAQAFKTRRVAENVLLFDDIVTTGATVQAAAKELKRAGAERIHVAIIARQPLDETPYL